MKLMEFLRFEKFNSYIIEFMGKLFEIIQKGDTFFYLDDNSDEKLVENESWLEFLEDLNL